MKSLKPGRGPSRAGAVGMGFVALFGVLWCYIAVTTSAWIMLPFGVLFVVLCIYVAIFHYRNATSEGRYSLIDIVESDEESDPLNEQYGRRKDSGRHGGEDQSSETSVTYCPYCGRPAERDYDFCPGCGRKLPD